MTARDAIASSAQFTLVRLSALERMFVRLEKKSEVCLVWNSST